MVDDLQNAASKQEFKPKRDRYVILPYTVATAGDYLYKKLISIKAERQAKAKNCPAKEDSKMHQKPQN
jgi:hypothetical protein